MKKISSDFVRACSWTSKAHGSQFHLKCLNFEVALTISGIIITPNVSINRNPSKTHVLVALGEKFQMFFFNISFFGLTYPFLEGGGGGNARGPKKIYIPRVIFNIPSPPWIGPAPSFHGQTGQLRFGSAKALTGTPTSRWRTQLGKPEQGIWLAMPGKFLWCLLMETHLCCFHISLKVISSDVVGQTKERKSGQARSFSSRGTGVHSPTTWHPQVPYFGRTKTSRSKLWAPLTQL